MSCNVTYQELAAFANGNLSEDRRRPLEDHLAACPTCQERLATVRQVDALLRALPPERPSAETILATRRLLSQETRPRPDPEILTLGEVAAFLRIEPDELGPLLADLPAFEIGGQVRVRRSRLLEWIEQREQLYSRGSSARAMARLRAGLVRKGVA